MFMNRNYKYNNKINNFNVINENRENHIRIRYILELLNKSINYDNIT